MLSCFWTFWKVLFSSKQLIWDSFITMSLWANMRSKIMDSNLIFIKGFKLLVREVVMIFLIVFAPKVVLTAVYLDIVQVIQVNWSQRIYRVKTFCNSCAQKPISKYLLTILVFNFLTLFPHLKQFLFTWTHSLTRY